MSNFKITTLTAFVTTDPITGDEGIMAIHDHAQGWMPCVFGDERREKSMLPMAIKVANDLGRPFRIIRMTSRIDVTDELVSKYTK